MFVKFIGPTGMKVTFYRGAAKSATLPVPCVVGLRPGYVYQVKLSDIPGYPQALYPTLEVRGSLIGGHKVKPQDFPAALVFTKQDIESARAGSFVSKIVVLEKVEKAFPEATTADNPILVPTFPGEDPVRQAHDIGTPLVLVRLGQREMSEAELEAKGIFGTVQLPGEAAMSQPSAPPYLPWMCPDLFDPKLGPNPPGADLCLPDGGDADLRAGWDINGKLVGLDPADTVAEYVDSKGQRKIAISNRVCICVPRFVVVRSERKTLDQSTVIVTSQMKNLEVGVVLKNIQPVLTQHQNVIVGSLASRLSISTTLAALGTVVYGKVEGLELYTNIFGPRGVTSTCITEEGELPDAPLCLIKWPDKNGAMIGDEITFTLKYTNQGGRPIHNVVISDSLLSRYEYVTGSQKSDRPATFTTQANEVNSQILRWEINEDLPPGQSGIVTFQVKIR
jgi:uncharacterized repeat protein (TIGR01451 family)